MNRNDIVIVRKKVFTEDPSNPARIFLDSGLLEINEESFDRFSPEIQNFIIEHEIGHYLHHTHDEQIADSYAFSQLALKKPNSLWNAVKSVYAISRDDPSRKRAAEILALQIAANDGSEEARKMLGQYANASGKLQKVTAQQANKYLYAILGIIIIAIAIYLILKK